MDVPLHRSTRWYSPRSPTKSAPTAPNTPVRMVSPRCPLSLMLALPKLQKTVAMAKAPQTFRINRRYRGRPPSRRGRRLRFRTSRGRRAGRRCWSRVSGIWTKIKTIKSSSSKWQGKDSSFEGKQNEPITFTKLYEL